MSPEFIVLLFLQGSAWLQMIPRWLALMILISKAYYPRYWIQLCVSCFGFAMSVWQHAAGGSRQNQRKPRQLGSLSPRAAVGSNLYKILPSQKFPSSRRHQSQSRISRLGQVAHKSLCWARGKPVQFLRTVPFLHTQNEEP